MTAVTSRTYWLFIRVVGESSRVSLLHSFAMQHARRYCNAQCVMYTWDLSSDCPAQSWTLSKWLNVIITHNFISLQKYNSINRGKCRHTMLKWVALNVGPRWPDHETENPHLRSHRPLQHQILSTVFVVWPWTLTYDQDVESGPASQTFRSNYPVRFFRPLGRFGHLLWPYGMVMLIGGFDFKHVVSH